MSKVYTPKFSRDELTDILRRHMHVYKDDEKFAQTIMDMAAFLVEYRAYNRRNLPPSDPADTATGLQRRQWLRATEQMDEDLKAVLSRYQGNRPTDCPLCGGPTEGRTMCPSCGNMTI